MPAKFRLKKFRLKKRVWHCKKFKKWFGSRYLLQNLQWKKKYRFRGGKFPVKERPSKRKRGGKIESKKTIFNIKFNHGFCNGWWIKNKMNKVCVRRFSLGRKKGSEKKFTHRCQISLYPNLSKWRLWTFILCFQIGFCRNWNFSFGEKIRLLPTFWLEKEETEELPFLVNFR